MTVYAYSTADEAIDCSDMSALKRPVLAQLIERLAVNDLVRMPTLSDAGKDEIDCHDTLAFFIENKFQLVIEELSDQELTTSPQLTKVIACYSLFQTNRIVQRFKKTQ